jgi:hypothetical protein
MQFASTVPVKSIKACVVYNPANGQIHHHHSVLTLVGGLEPEEHEMANDALRFIKDRARPLPKGELQVLHINHDAMEPNKRYRVDHKKRVLVAIASRAVPRSKPRRVKK